MDSEEKPGRLDPLDLLGHPDLPDQWDPPVLLDPRVLLDQEHLFNLGHRQFRHLNVATRAVTQLPNRGPHWWHITCLWEILVQVVLMVGLPKHIAWRCPAVE